MLGSIRKHNLTGSDLLPGCCVLCGTHPVQAHHVVPGCRTPKKGRPESPKVHLCAKHHDQAHGKGKALHWLRLYWMPETSQWWFRQTNIADEYEALVEGEAWHALPAYAEVCDA